VLEQDVASCEEKEYVWQDCQLCPGGLTKSQKRRVQRLRNQELKENRHQVWRPKPSASKRVLSANAIFILPAEFRAPTEENEDEEESTTKLVFQAESAIFNKLEKHLHLKALYLKGFIDGKPMTKMLVDGGVAVNLMPYTTFRKLGKRDEDLLKTDVRLQDFSGKTFDTRGAVNVELTIGSKTMLTTFFVIDGKGTYSLLLGHDWIHANCCIPSTMHQCVIQWIGDTIEVVQADTSVNVALAEPSRWNFEGIECFSGKTWNEGIVSLSDDSQQPIQAIGLECLF
jgi:hypothetical protein